MNDLPSSEPATETASDPVAPSNVAPPDHSPHLTPSSPTPQPSQPVTTPPTSTDISTVGTRLLKRAQSSLSQTIKRYTWPSSGFSQALNQPDLQNQLEQLAKDLNKLEQRVLRVAVFGMVSRGKSSVINALVQQDVVKTGPLHGVTKWPRSVYWEPKNNPAQLRIELIDTPGIDEVGGAAREEMAQEVAQEADLILFVLAGDLTQTEYHALARLRQQRKPLVLVCNKMDEYPNHNQALLIRQLETLEQSTLQKKKASKTGKALQQGSFLEPKDRQAFSLDSISSDSISSDSKLLDNDLSRKTSGGRAIQLGQEESTPWTLTAHNIVHVAAAPTPIQVRVEWPDGNVSYEWETPKPQISALEQHLHHLLEREGLFLIALNALRKSQSTEVKVAATTMRTNAEQAEELLWQFAKWKGLAIAVNPIALLDIVGNMAVDLVLIRSLSRLYGLPMTGYNANKLWNSLLWSVGGLAVGEIGSSLFWNLGKSTTLITGSLGGSAVYATTAIAQAVLAGYGLYGVGRTAKTYLQQGCTWGPHGSSTVIETLFHQTDDVSIVAQLKEQLQEKTIGKQEEQGAT